MARPFIVNSGSSPISSDIENFGESVAKYEKDECSITELGLLERVNEVGVGRPRTFFKYAEFSSKDDDSDKIASSVHMF